MVRYEALFDGVPACQHITGFRDLAQRPSPMWFRTSGLSFLAENMTRLRQVICLSPITKTSLIVSAAAIWPKVVRIVHRRRNEIRDSDQGDPMREATGACAIADIKTDNRCNFTELCLAVSDRVR
jgi:hypothetical protein